MAMFSDDVRIELGLPPEAKVGQVCARLAAMGLLIPNHTGKGPYFSLVPGRPLASMRTEAQAIHAAVLLGD